MITVYTAGPWADREFVKGVAAQLRIAGYKVNSRWLDVDPNPPDGVEQEDYYRMQALNDLQDVLEADVLFYINTGTLSEGKATELGVSLATLKPIIIVGPGGRKNNIFLRLNIPHYETAEEAIEWMRGEERAHEVRKTGVIDV